MLTAESLQGIWAFVPTPFDKHDRFDEEVFHQDIEYLCQSELHGIYTTSSSGEFYSL